MDNKRPLIVEIERTSLGCIVTDVFGIDESNEMMPDGSGKIQIPLPQLNKEQKIRKQASYISKQSVPVNPPQEYNVYPSLNQTPVISEEVTPPKKIKEEIQQKAINDIVPLPVIPPLEKKSPLILMPSCASWFNLDEIHDIEKKALEEFFSGKYPSKTPQVYKEYRDFMVRLYRSNPQAYLPVTTCRRYMAGDVGGILRIHSFLDHWGIINFCVDPHLKPHRMGLSRPEVLNTKLLINTAGIKSERFTEPENEQFSATESQSYVLSGNVNALPKFKRPICDFCGEVCGLVWFHHRLGLMGQEKISILEREPFSIYSLSLCEPCYDKGNFPKLMNKSDFELCSIKPDNTNFQESEWTKEETTKLFKVIAKYGNDWDKIMEELKSNGCTKSQDDCIVRFMSAPINEFKELREKIGKEENKAKIPNNPALVQLYLIGKGLEDYANKDENGEKLTKIKYNEDLNKKSVRRVKKLIKKEKKEIRRLMNFVVDVQLKKLEAKVEFFNEFDLLLQNERVQIKAMQRQIFEERVNISMSKSDVLVQANSKKSFDGSRKESDLKPEPPPNVVQQTSEPKND